MLRLAFVFSILLSTFFSSAQDVNTSSRKGEFFGFWGWNRGWYTDSDIHFKGADYDFTLVDVQATDRQTPFALDPYFHPGRITIPQTNMRLGYFLTDQIAISLGVDHMKYVMVQYQDVNITGDIGHPSSIYQGSYDNQLINLDDKFLRLEHTDGLNYINFEAAYYYDILDGLKRAHKNIDVHALGGIGLGFLYPKTNVTLFDQERYDDFNVAGYGFSAKLGLEVSFWDHFFLRSEYKAGYINMPNVRTTADAADSASQSFGFRQFNYLFGWRFRLGGRK